ncbi:hypothetical protein [Bdellovibrio bacteriovorus]|uniref:ATP-grasp domain-containing protein n=1 Tax=Bdellovibrio bacteriovorus str. Tiberius TaxID=1069642 RepID=K7YXG2_BDEBC|nr:hypothetical protein [Bdellovibrio bacteriovorus]AFY02368.1 Hypothetical protein Bdt_2686 [Bdellovibrio bacteriovorus str. Tiberius]
MKHIHCRPVRNRWLKALYENNLVEASTRTRLYADKLYLYQELEKTLGPKLHLYHPKTWGLKAFLAKYDLTSPDSLQDTARIEQALLQEFPTNVILKPAAVINTAGETGLYLFSRESILQAFEDQNKDLVQACLRETVYVSSLLGILAGGEEFILQEHIAALAGYPVVTKTRHYQEVRIHTFENEVLKGASYSRWQKNEIKNSQDFYRAQDFVQEFLNQLPAELLKGQAWGLDLLIFENGTVRILEINTNRGAQGQWTGFLSRPELMGAYTRLIEKKKGVRFAGLSGIMLRLNLGNITKHLKKKYIEGIR